jgi:hypothetical protein
MLVYQPEPAAPAPLPAPAPGLPPAPTGLYPHDSIKISTDCMRMITDTVPGATKYEFEIQHFQGGVFKPYYTYAATQNAQKFCPNYDNRVYQFRARAKNASGFGPWSDWAIFEYGNPTERPVVTDPEPTDPEPTDPEPTDPEPTDPEPTDPEPTDPEPVDGAPTNLLPADGATVATPSVTMSCDAVTGADRYRFEIQNWSTSQSQYVAYYSYEGSAASRTFWPAIPNVAYRFRVFARVNGTWGPESVWSVFLFGNATLP